METMDVMRALFPGLQSISFIVMQCVLYEVDVDGPEEGQEKVLLVKLGGLKMYIFSAKNFSLINIKEMVGETLRDISDKRSILSTDIFCYDSDTKKLTVA